MRARLAVMVSIASACGRSVLVDAAGVGETTVGVESSGSVQDPLTGGDPSGQPPPVDTTVDDVTTEPPDPSSPDPSIDTGWIPDFASACGNGELGAGEECDDGNYDDDDACTSSCTIPFAIEWTVTHNGTASGFDAAHDVLVDGAGNILVVGTMAQEGQARDVWLQQYWPDGSTAWAYTWDGADHRDDIGRALVVTSDADIVVVGSTESDATGDDVLVMRLDGATLTEEWVSIVDGPGSGSEDYEDADDASDVLVDAAGHVIVAGRIRVGALDWDAWIRRYDAQGGALTTTTYDGAAGGQDRARSLALASDGTPRVLAEVESDDGIAGAVLAFDEFDMLADIVPIDTVGAGIVRSADGTFLVAGSDSEDQGFETDYDIRSYTAGLAPQWSTVLDSASDDDTAHAIAIGEGEMAYVVGASGRAGEQENGRLYAIDHGGQTWWGDEHDGPADLEDSFESVAVDPSGNVVVVGFESVLGEQTNTLVRMYRPL